MVKSSFFKGCIITLAFTCSLLVNATTNVEVSVDRNPVMVNESFVLEILADDSLNNSDIDLAGLSRSGLVVGRTSTSSQTQIINGNISRTTTWSVVLLARSEGQYQIPAIEVDGVKSKPITVNVIKANTNDGDKLAPIFIKNSLSSSKVYLQQSLQLTTKLYLSPEVNLQSGTLSDPSLDQANIQQQGKDKNDSEIVNGQRYRIIERTYLVTPQASGEFDILSPTFNGEISTGRRSAFSAFANTKPVSTIGDDLKLTVLAIPNGYQGTWLPSELVQLNDELQPKQKEYEVGEPITRTFTLSALNVNEEQLPTITGTYPSSFKVYPDKSETFSDIRNYGMVSQRVNSEAIVATQPGTYQLPEVTLSWFNTLTQKVEKARIPAKTIVIVAGQNQLSDNNAITNLQQGLNSANTEQCPTSEPLQCPDMKETQTSNYFAWLGWILWLITALWAVWKLKTKPQNTPENKAEQKVMFDDSEFKKYCKNNEINAIRTELLLWANILFDKPLTNLLDLIPLVSENLAKQIRLLHQSQYSNNQVKFNGMELYQAFKENVKQEDRKNDVDLPPLN